VQVRRAAERERDGLSAELVDLRAARLQEGRRHEEEVRMMAQRMERLRPAGGVLASLAAHVSGLVHEVRDCNALFAGEVAACVASSSEWEVRQLQRQREARPAATGAAPANAEARAMTGRLRALEEKLAAKEHDCAQLRLALERQLRGRESAEVERDTRAAQTEEQANTAGELDASSDAAAAAASSEQAAPHDADPCVDRCAR